jgi:hypothetical protein
MSLDSAAEPTALDHGKRYRTRPEVSKAIANVAYQEDDL